MSSEDCNCTSNIICKSEKPFCVYEKDGVYEYDCEHHCLPIKDRPKRFNEVILHFTGSHPKSQKEEDWEMVKFYEDIVSSSIVTLENSQCICSAHIKKHCYIKHKGTDKIFLIGGVCLERLSKTLSKLNDKSYKDWKNRHKYECIMCGVGKRNLRTKIGKAGYCSDDCKNEDLNRECISCGVKNIPKESESWKVRCIKCFKKFKSENAV